ncbi:MAG: patatin-like phospholipase family protein, partial [Proteobacteria bacterium]|nr:patatin-like phospholipase family protein [Pseudomonadota bacterium]
MAQDKQKMKVEFSKVGLVCSGGATKAAAFHIGVCLALRDKGFSFVGGKAENPSPINSIPYPPPKYHPQQISTYVGSSAGSLITTLLASGIPVESLINSFTSDINFKIPGEFAEIPKIQYRDMLKINWPRPSAILKSFKQSPLLGRTLESIVLKNLRLPGLFSTAGIAKYLQDHVLPTPYFHELKADLFVVGTQLDHSRKIIFGRYSTEKTYDEYSQYASNATIFDAVGASLSLPPIFAPYKVKHGPDKTRYYIDGEIRETLSTHVAKENGCDLLICSYTHQPYHYRDEIGSLVHYGMPAIVIQALYQAIEQKVYAARRAHENKSIVLQTVREFFAEKKYPAEDMQELLKILAERIDFKGRLNYIFIHPEAKDKQMFFGDHF